MRSNITIFNSTIGRGDGAIEINGEEILIFKKSIATRLLFGAIGAALAHGKEAMRFTAADIQSYQIEKKTFTDRMTITLKDSGFVTFNLKNEIRETIMPILEGINPS